MIIGCRLACGNERWIANGLVSWAFVFVSAIVGVGLSPSSRSWEPSLNCPLRTGKYFHLMGRSVFALWGKEEACSNGETIGALRRWRLYDCGGLSALVFAWAVSCSRGGIHFAWCRWGEVPACVRNHGRTSPRTENLRVHLYAVVESQPAWEYKYWPFFIDHHQCNWTETIIVTWRDAFCAKKKIIFFFLQLQCLIEKSNSLK